MMCLFYFISTDFVCRTDDVLGKVLSGIQVLLDPIHMLINLFLVFEMFVLVR